MNVLDLELLREILKDGAVHFDVVEVEEVEFILDRSEGRIRGKTQPEGVELIATISWSICSTGGGLFMPPKPKDWVLVAYKSVEQAFVIKCLSSTDDKIPMETALDGDTCLGAQDGKQLHLYSDTAVLLGKKNYLTPPDEPLVLGNVMKAFMNDIITLLKTTPIVLTTSPGNPGAPNPAFAVAIDAIKLQYLDTPLTDILSQVVFTERGAI